MHRKVLILIVAFSVELNWTPLKYIINQYYVSCTRIISTSAFSCIGINNSIILSISDIQTLFVLFANLYTKMKATNF